MSAVETLTKARDLIARPNGWTRGVEARNKFGDHVDYRSPDATCFCALGALCALALIIAAIAAPQAISLAYSIYADRHSVRRVWGKISHEIATPEQAARRLGV